MKKVSIEVPNEVLEDVIGVLVKRLEQVQGKMKSLEDILNDVQYRHSALENERRSLKEENRRLRAMLEHEDENWQPPTAE